jgi:hypothetical protein
MDEWNRIMETNVNGTMRASTLSEFPRAMHLSGLPVNQYLTGQAWAQCTSGRFINARAELTRRQGAA